MTVIDKISVFLRLLFCALRRSIAALSIALLALLFVQCKADADIYPENEQLIGSWIHPVYNETYTQVQYEKANRLTDNAYGFTFLSNHSFVERKNAGWCGTPPIAYADFDGTWATKGSIINITVGYWGGQMTYQWKIISIDEQNLVIESIQSEIIEE